MLQILIYGALFVEMLIAISQAISFQVRVKDRHAINRQIIISCAFSLQCVMSIAMLLVRSDTSKYLMYAAYWYAGVVLVANLLNMGAYSMNYHGKFVGLIISVLYYLGLAIYFADTFLSGGTLKKAVFGVSYPIASVLQIILHAVFNVIYLAGLVYIYHYFNRNDLKKRERYLMRLWLLTFSFSALGAILELTDMLFDPLHLPHLPYLPLTCIGTILLMPKLLIYHRKIVIREEDYEDILRKNIVDIVLICDDSFRVVYTNKRGMIVGKVIKNDFIGQRVEDLFLMTPETEARLHNESINGSYSINAIYAPLNRDITIDVRPVYDRFHELFISVITICGMENEEADTAPIEIRERAMNVTVPDEPESEFKIARGARLLIVNENSIRINVFEKMLQPYAASVFRALNAKSAIKEISEHVYDMIFIDQNISDITAFELAEEIRGMPGPYYQEVPLVFITDVAMDEQYKEFLLAGFNDYLVKPVSAKYLNHVLTRWLWKRYANADDTVASSADDLLELNLLLDDCDRFYESKESLLFAGCLRAVRQQCVLLHLPEYESDARELFRMLLMEDHVSLEKTYHAFVTAFRSYLAGNGAAS